MKKFLFLTWIQSGTLITLVILAILLGASFALTTLLIAGICWAFGWVFSWKIAFGVWLILWILQSVFGKGGNSK